MQVVLAVLALIIGGLYFTVGIRLGSVTMMPTQMYAAKGESEYGFRTNAPEEKVGVSGTCSVSSGSADLYFYGPDGTLKSQPISCTVVPGSENIWKVEQWGEGQPGFYTLKIVYKDFTGKIDIQEQRGGHWD